MQLCSLPDSALSGQAAAGLLQMQAGCHRGVGLGSMLQKSFQTGLVSMLVMGPWIKRQASSVTRMS